jgi:ABC-type Fe3+ transport system substrate-binding protein
MVEITGWRAGAYSSLANSMDKIGWRRFMEWMISKEIIAIQRKAEDNGRCKMTVKNRSAGLVTKLLEVTHGQWLYRNVHVHDMVKSESNDKEGRD